MIKRRMKNYWDQVSDHEDSESMRANPDILATPDPTEELADKSLLYQSVINLPDPYKELIINNLGLFGRKPMSLRELARLEKVSKDQMYRTSQKAQQMLRDEFFRLLEGGRIDGLPKDVT